MNRANKTMFYLFGLQIGLHAGCSSIQSHITLIPRWPSIVRSLPVFLIKCCEQAMRAFCIQTKLVEPETRVVHINDFFEKVAQNVQLSREMSYDGRRHPQEALKYINCTYIDYLSLVFKNRCRILKYC